MNDIEKQIKATLDSVTAGLEPSEEIENEVFSRLDQGLYPSFLFIRIPVAVSFFTTIMAIPISVY